MGAYKRLVFHFYADEKYKEKRAIKIHLECLKYYHDIFDEALFCIALDDVSNVKLAQSVEKDIVECGFKNVQFKIVQNDVFREATTFYNEVACKMDKLNGMTFFGHTKGYTNYDRMPNHATVESLDTWLTGLYYLSLNNINEVEQNLFGQPCFNNFYGSFLSYCKEDCFGLDFVLYSGTFYWVNGLQLAQEKYWKIPPIDTIAYAEDFLSKFYKLSDFSNKVNHRYSGPSDYLAFYTNYYALAPQVIGLFLENDEEKIKKFYEFKQNIIANV